ncbi:MAG: hypothetical protein U0P81_15400 [Holophagaceae bacterium]
MPRGLILVISLLVGLWGTHSARGSSPKDRAMLLAVSWFPTLAGLLSLIVPQD